MTDHDTRLQVAIQAEAGEAFYEAVAGNLHLMRDLAEALDHMAADEDWRGPRGKWARVARDIHLSCDEAHRRYCGETGL